MDSELEIFAEEKENALKHIARQVIDPEREFNFDLKQKSLLADSFIHKMGMTCDYVCGEVENISYSRQTALNAIRLDNKDTSEPSEPQYSGSLKTRQNLADVLINRCNAIVEDYNGEPNVFLRQDIVYALRVAATLIGPSGEEKDPGFGFDKIAPIIDKYNKKVESAYNRGSTIDKIQIESYVPEEGAAYRTAVMAIVKKEPTLVLDNKLAA